VETMIESVNTMQRTTKLPDEIINLFKKNWGQVLNLFKPSQAEALRLRPRFLALSFSWFCSFLLRQQFSNFLPTQWVRK